MTDSHTIYLLLPEIILIAAATAIFLVDAFVSLDRIAGWFAIGAIAVAALVLYAQFGSHGGQPSPLLRAPHTSGPLAVDLFGCAARWLVLPVGLVLMLLFLHPLSVRQRYVPHNAQNAEQLATLMLILAGLMIVAAANELILLFIGLELVSIPTYVLLYIGRHDAQGQEAASKYFFLSILSSAVLLYGFSFLYGMAGSTRLEVVAAALTGPADKAPFTSTLAPLAMLLIVGGLAFRLTVVPFHFYAPDVYQGTSHANAAVLSTLPKIAGLTALARLTIAAMPTVDMAELGWKTMLVLSILTMTLGNVLALWQNNVRRLLAYSSIAHAGYLLIGFTVALAAQLSIAGPASDSASTVFDGLGASLFYLVVYIFSTLGAFAALAFLSPGSTHQVDTLDDLAGLNRRHPIVAIMLTIFLFSLTGLPPLAGFWGKFQLLFSALTLDVSATPGGAALRPWFIGLAIVTVLNAAIAAAYYLRVVGAMYFRAPHEKPLPITRHAGPGFAIAACAAVVIGIGLLPARTLAIMNRAAESLEQNGVPTAPAQAQAEQAPQNVAVAVSSR